MYRQASLVVPLAVPSPLAPRVRGVLALDPSSAWHTSALLSAAVESATLPSRLRDPANRESLGRMADRLNVHGRQTVAGLQMSFSSAGAAPQARPAGAEPKDGLRLDMDFRPADDLGGGGGGGSRQQDGSRAGPKIFSQVLTSRGGEDGDGGQDVDMDEDEDDRARRRGRGEAVSRRYRSGLGYPLPDSFPSIFRDGEGGALRGSIAVTTSLSTDAALSGRLRALRSTVSGLVGVEDREALGNELAGMADEYHEGWSSGSDSGEDD